MRVSLRMPPTTSLSTVSTAPPAPGFSAASRPRTAAEASCSSRRKCWRGRSPPRTDLHRQRIIAARALDQHAEAGVGKARAGIPGDGMHDLPIAARHQHLGDRFAQGLALGDGGEVLLALARGIGDEVGFVEPLGRRSGPDALPRCRRRRRACGSTPGGALCTGASRLESLARALASIAVTSLTMTSSNRLIWPGE